MGGAVAKALAGAGARVFLSGRDLGSVQKTAGEILASDMAGKITGITVDVTSGTTAGLNYRVVKKGGDK
jgi:NADP-dependent 3-hydroxy acid dehydrogenase YdfG